jgi:hypothetical protein
MSFEEEAKNSKTLPVAVGIGVALLLAGGTWWYLHSRAAKKDQVLETTVAAVAVGSAAPPPAILHPLNLGSEAAPAADPAAPVNQDAVAASTLAQVFGSEITSWLVPERLTRRLVATVDNLPRNSRIEPLRPLRAPSSPVVVERTVLDAADGTERITLAPANSARYNAVIALVARTDPAAAAAAYRRLYPSLQKSYEDLGYPTAYFNDRVVQVIDHLLETPEPTGPLLLEQPKVLYRFADAELEDLSNGQKLLLRMGVDHARVVKDKLRAFRALIVSKE